MADAKNADPFLTGIPPKETLYYNSTTEEMKTDQLPSPVPTKCTPICTLLRSQTYIFWLLGIGQSWPPQKLGFNLATLKLIYAGTILLFTSVPCINLVYTLYTSRMGALFGMAMASFLWNIQAVISFIVAVWLGRSEQFYSFRGLLMQADEQAGIKNQLKWSICKLCVYYLAGVLFCSLNLLAMVSFTIHNFIGVPGNVFGELIVFPGSNYLALFTEIYMSVSWYLVLVNTLVISDGLADQISYFNECLLNESNVGSKIIKSYFDRHQLIVRAADKAEALLSHYLMLIYGLLIPQLLVIVYALIIDHNSVIVNIVLTSWIIAGIAEIILLSLTNARINAEAEKCKTVLGNKIFDWGFDICNEPEMVGCLQLLSGELQYELGISVGGFVTVTKGLIITVFSVLATYLTILLQTYIGSSAVDSVMPLEYNGTTVASTGN